MDEGTQGTLKTCANRLSDLGVERRGRFVAEAHGAFLRGGTAGRTERASCAASSTSTVNRRRRPRRTGCRRRVRGRSRGRPAASARSQAARARQTRRVARSAEDPVAIDPLPETSMALLLAVSRRRRGRSPTASPLAGSYKATVFVSGYRSATSTNDERSEVFGFTVPRARRHVTSRLRSQGSSSGRPRRGTSPPTQPA